MKKCQLCRGGNSGPCNSAVDRIYAIQTSKKKIDSDSIDIGCPWFINSSEHNYCFWKYAETLDEVIPDKDICNLLLIDSATLKATYESAIKKLQELKNTPELQDFKEALMEKIAALTADNTTYLPDEFAAYVDGVDNTEEEDTDAALFEDKPKRVKRIGKSMPLHIGGKKVDIYFGKTKRKSYKGD